MGEVRHIRRKQENPGKASNSASNGLTGIHGSIHWPATPTDVEAASEYNVPDGSDELDRIAIDNFLGVLAEIALGIAAREASAKDEGKDRDS
jgi:hypothetical protein